MRKAAVIAGFFVLCVVVGLATPKEQTPAPIGKIDPGDPVSAFGDAVPPDKAAALEALPEAGVAPTGETVMPAAYTPEIEPEPPPRARLYVTGSSVNVRAEPTTASAKLGKLTRGTEVEALAQQEGWIRIALPDGSLQGWMSDDFLTDTAPAALVPAPEPEPRSREIAPPALADVRKATQAIIDNSIASYPGSCPCPYNRDRAGRRCGDRSAWSKPGGYAPVCYDSDVSAALLDSYFARARGAVD